MEFRPGQTIKRERGTTYIKDAIQTQVDPPKPVVPKPKATPKKEDNEAVQHEQVVQKPVPTGSKPVRRKGGSSSKSNRSGNSGS